VNCGCSAAVAFAASCAEKEDKQKNFSMESSKGENISIIC